jgi:cell wall-associated NlpC family hydrolase
VPTPNGPLAKRAGVGLAVAAAIVGGTLVARDQLQSGASRATSQNRYAALQVYAASGKRTVPFLGPFAHNKKGVRQCGPEVRLMEGALRLTTPPIRKLPASNCVGLITQRQIKAFQKRHQIPISGIYGLRTHRALAHAYTDKQIADLRYIRITRIRAAKYVVISTVTAHAKAYEGRMVYCNYGSLSSCGSRWNWPAWPDVPHHTDCSGYVTWVYYQAGLPDPNGLGFTGGFTGTLVTHGIPISPTSADRLRIGDLILNGPSAFNTTHVSIYIGKGLTSGHGRFGIQIHQWNYRPVVAVRRFF